LLENIEVEKIQFELTEDFLAKLKREFGKGNDESAKVVKFKKVE